MKKRCEIMEMLGRQDEPYRLFNYTENERIALHVVGAHQKTLAGAAIR